MVQGRLSSGTGEGFAEFSGVTRTTTQRQDFDIKISKSVS